MEECLSRYAAGCRHATAPSRHHLCAPTVASRGAPCPPECIRRVRTGPVVAILASTRPGKYAARLRLDLHHAGNYVRYFATAPRPAGCVHTARAWRLTASARRQPRGVHKVYRRHFQAAQRGSPSAFQGGGCASEGLAAAPPGALHAAAGAGIEHQHHYGAA